MENLGKQKKVLVISDTHIGGDCEEIQYLNIVYDFAIKNNITKIIHAGDLFDGFTNCRNSIYKTPDKQIEHLINDYPKDKNIKNYILYGNHDYKLSMKVNNLNDYLKKRDDLINIGIKIGYVTINNTMFKIFHRLSKLKCSGNLILNCDLNFYGHSHKLIVKEEIREIHVPALCNDIKYNNIYPGFILVEFDNNNYILTVYNIHENKLEENKVYTFTKR